MLYSLVTPCISSPPTLPLAALPRSGVFLLVTGTQGYTCRAAAGGGSLPHFIQVSIQMLSPRL